MHHVRLETILLAMLGLILPAAGQTWTPLNSQPSFAAATTFLMTDGSVLVQEYFSYNWYRLTPDSTGSYINGSWTQVASTSPSYTPLYYASAVLADGRLLVLGGEYSAGGGETAEGAIFDPAYDYPTGRWTSTPPTMIVVLRWPFRFSGYRQKKVCTGGTCT
jgi:hypothetical protein